MFLYMCVQQKGGGWIDVTQGQQKWNTLWMTLDTVYTAASAHSTSYSSLYF